MQTFSDSPASAGHKLARLLLTGAAGILGQVLRESLRPCAHVPDSPHP